MSGKLFRRGPDGNGVQTLDHATLGHARLVILDIEGGIHGEACNYRELQSQHLADQNIITHFDIEVLLHLYRKLEPPCVENLDGMFAFVIVEDDRFLIARHPSGKQNRSDRRTARGGKGPVKLVYTIVNRKDLPDVIGTIHDAYPKTFFTVEELRSVEQGVFPARSVVHQDAVSGRKSK